jgi:hypothetical protein
METECSVPRRHQRHDVRDAVRSETKTEIPHERPRLVAAIARFGRVHRREHLAMLSSARMIIPVQRMSDLTVVGEQGLRLACFDEKWKREARPIGSSRQCAGDDT